MNDQGSKKILFKKSTLWSLKAELLKKQEEVNEKKQLPQHKLENFKPPPSRQAVSKHENTNKKKSFKDSLKAIDIEELELSRKIKLALEKKAEIYEHLSDSVGNSQLASEFLVDFNAKKKQDPPVREPSPEPDHFEDQLTSDDSDEWTEFSDCLGRTRKCLVSDLDLYLMKDKDLIKTLNKDPIIVEDTPHKEEPKPEKPLLVQKTNDYLQSLREKWEQKEKELLAKNKDIHYQDVLFDEARMHGVGYYSFSTNEDERQNQLAELLRQREATLEAQKRSAEERKKRAAAAALRAASARARMRAAAGLPPEDPKDEQKDFTTCLLEFLTRKKDEADALAKQRDQKVREEKEKERQKLREAYVREWDLGKDGVEGKPGKFREMTQEEYVEQQRDKRINEFAPPAPSSSSNYNSSNAFDNKGKQVDRDDCEIEKMPPKTWADVRPKPRTPSPPVISDIIEQKGLYFSTSTKKKETVIKYKNFVKDDEAGQAPSAGPTSIDDFNLGVEPTPIVNELSDEEDTEARKPRKRKGGDDYAEIEPPPTHEYYEAAAKQRRPQQPFTSDVREAYAQGAKSLEPKSSNRKLPAHYDFTFD